MKSSRWNLAPRWPSLRLLCLLLCATALLISCATGRRVVFIDSDGALIRTGPDVRGRVYFLNASGEWELSKNAVPIPEGWFAGPMKSAPAKPTPPR